MRSVRRGVSRRLHTIDERVTFGNAVQGALAFLRHFERANATFSLGSMPANELRLKLDRWTAWHLVRSGLSLAALTAAVLAAWQ